MVKQHTRSLALYGVSLLALTALAARPARANLVKDGDFEASKLKPYWTVSGSVKLINSFPVTDPDGGFQFAKLFTNGKIRQAITLQKGQEYKLTFDAATANTGSAVKVAVGQLSLSQTLFSPVVGKPFQLESAIFVAKNNGKLDLSFTSVGTSKTAAVFVDNVSVVPVPEFGSILGLSGLVAAGGFAGFRRRRRQG